MEINIMFSQKIDHELQTIHLYKKIGNNEGSFYYKIKWVVTLCAYIKIKFAESYIYLFNHRAMDVNMGEG